MVPNARLDALAIRQAAAERLPATMLPDHFIVVADLPLTSSSKVDERRLLNEAGLATPRPSHVEIDSLVKGTAR